MHSVARFGVARRLPVLVLALALAATAACGARWTDEERADVYARHARAAATVPAPSGIASAGDTALSPLPGGPATADEELVGGGGPAPGPASGASGPAPCAAPTDAPGVTADRITVGSISSLSGPVSGLGASSAAAARAYVAYRNSTGGVCGRQVVLKEGDDGTETSRYRGLVADMAKTAFGMVGGFALGDVGGLDLIEQAKLPVVNVPSDDRGTAVSTLFDINPPFEDPDAVVGKYRYLHDQGVRTAQQTYLAVSQSRLEAQRQARLMRAAGIQVVDVQELPVSTLSYDGPARRVANSKADYLFFIGDARGNGAMARSMEATGYEPKFEEYFTFAYGESFIAQAGPGAEGATTWLRTLPNEEAGANPEMARFVEWMERTAPGTVRDVFAADSWAGAKAFFDSLAALPGPITRGALVAQLRSVGTYDAGGMLGPIRLGEELTNGCVIGMQVRGGEWRRMVPASGFLC